MRFLVLGPLQVVERDLPVNVAGRKERALLALLLSRANHVVSVDEIIEQLWEGAPPRSAAKSLQAHVVRLRQAIADGRPRATESQIVTESPGYTIRVRPDQVDAVWFRERVQYGREALRAGACDVAAEALRDAESPWRGQPYAGFELDWLVEERGRLEQELVECVEDRIDADLGRGLGPSLVGELEAMVAAEPLRERRWGQLMLALYGAGRQADALASFSRARSLLADELGVDPGEDLVRLHARVLDQDPELLPGSHRRLFNLPPELDRSHELAGREAELAGLLDWWQSTTPVCVVAGPDGSGKTRLCAELAAILVRDAVAVLYASARPPTTEPLAVLRRLLAGLGMTPAELSVAAGVPADLGTAVGRRVARIGMGQRVLVIIDDIDAAPDEALGGVRAMLGELGGSAAVLLSGCDPFQPDNRDRIDLGPLPHDAVVQIAASYIGPEKAGLLAADVDPHAQGLPARIHEQVAGLARRLVGQEVVVALDRAAEGKSASQLARAELVSGLERSERLVTSHHTNVTASPYRGLSSFGVTDADVFFGREQVVRELLATAATSSVVTLVGSSGTGKSSVARAGLLAALRRGTIPGSERWAVVDFSPGRHPMAALAREAGGLLERDSGDGGRIVLLVDQFEEVVTACDDVQERARFLQALVDFAARGAGEALVLIAVRDDYLLPTTAADADFAALAVDGLVVLPTMVASDLARVVELPARRRGVSVEPALVNAVITDVAGASGALPLLSTAFLELWEARSGPTLGLAAYQRLGGIHRAVGRLAEAAWGRLDSTEQRSARRMLLRMAGEESGQPIRRRVPLSELDSEGDTGQRVLRSLAAGRLVTMSSAVDGASVEVVHEAVFAHWPRFADWLAQDAAGRAIQLQMAEHARRWADGGRESDDLYRGSRLAGALGWLEEHPEVANDLEREFLTESRMAAEARVDAEREQHARTVRSARRLRVVVAGVVLLLIVSAVTGLVALDQRGTARRAADLARGQAQAAHAAELAASVPRQPTPDLALLAAVAAYQMDDTVESRSSLLTLLSQAPRLRSVLSTGVSPITDLAAAPKRDGVAVGHVNGRIQLTSPPGPAGVVSLSTPDKSPILDLAWSPASRSLAVATASGVRVMSSTGREIVLFATIGSRPTDQTVGVAWLSRSSVVGVTRDGRVERLGVRTGSRDLLARVGRDVRVGGVDTTPGGGLLVSQRRRLTVLDASTRPVSQVHVRGAPGWHSWLPDGRLLGVDDGTDVVTRDPRTLDVERRFRGHRERVLVVASDPSGEVLASAALDGTIILWDAGSGTQLDSFAYPNGTVSRLAFTDAGRTLVTAATDRSVVAWDVTGAHSFVRSPQRPGPERSTAAADADVLPVDIRAPGHVGTSLVRRLETGPGVLGRVRVGEIRSVRRLPGQRGTMVGGSSGRVAFVDSTTGDPLHPPIRMRSAINTIEPEPYGTSAAVGTAHGLAVVDTVSWRSGLVIRQPHPVDSIAFAPGSTRVAVGYRNGSVAVLEWPGLTEQSRTAPRPRSLGPVISVAWTPDGTRVVSGGMAGALIVTDAETGRPAAPRVTLNRQPLAVDISPDGETIVASGGDGTVALWDMDTGASIGPPLVVIPGTHWVFASFGVQGRAIVAVVGRAGGQVWTWPADPDRWAQRACSVAGRDLTAAERAELGIAADLAVCPSA